MRRIAELLLKSNTYKTLFWIWFALIVILSSYPDLSPEESQTKRLFSIRLDYLAHIVMYLILSSLLFLWRSRLEGISTKQGIAYSLLLIAFSYVEELHQMIIPGRSYNLVDFVYNSVGVLLGYLISSLLIRYRSLHWLTDLINDEK